MSGYPRHGHARTGVASGTYRSWQAIIQRCTNANNPGYSAYGGRGITICDRWRESFEAFLADMGERPDGTSIDRIDGSGNYEPSNCRWASRYVQNKNRSASKMSSLGAVLLRQMWIRGREFGCKLQIAAYFDLSYRQAYKIGIGESHPRALDEVAAEAAQEIAALHTHDGATE